MPAKIPMLTTMSLDLADSSVWVRLTLWGFTYTQITLELGGDEVPLTGDLRNDRDKHAHYVLFRISLASCLPVPSTRREEATTTGVGAAGCAAEGLAEAESWRLGLEHVSLPLGVRAKVLGVGGLQTHVALEGDLQIRLALADSSQDLKMHAPALKEACRASIGALAPALEPIALLSSRTYAKAAILEASPSAAVRRTGRPAGDGRSPSPPQKEGAAGREAGRALSGRGPVAGSQV